MYKIGVVGDKNTVLAFQAIGIEGVIALDKDEARRRIDQMAADQFAVIFVTEALAAFLGETIARYKCALMPAVILIPGQHGSLNLGMQSIKDNMEKAVGVNLLQPSENLTSKG
jgi:V/A-type H+-transporting ATPase subunit F